MNKTGNIKNRMSSRMTLLVTIWEFTGLKSEALPSDTRGTIFLFNKVLLHLFRPEISVLFQKYCFLYT